MIDTHHIERLRRETIKRLDALIPYIFSNAKITYQGKEIRVGNKGSLKINRVTGGFKSYETNKSGDIFAFIQFALGCSFIEALRWAEAFVGCNATVVNQYKSSQNAARHIDTTKIAEDIYYQAKPIKGSAGEIYLESRSIEISSVSNGLLFHSNLYLTSNPVKLYRPALVAVVRDWDKKFVGIQRIFINNNGTKIKLDGISTKKSLGSISKGFFHAGAEIKNEVAICEGVIDALSIWQLYQIPTIATLGTSNFYTLQLPSRISKVYIYADNDSAGIMAANALHTRLVSTGIYSDIRLPPENMKDMNEYLMTIPESVEVDLFGEC